jgi:uncharacterized protein YbjQ (UPF0145 family)
VANWEDVGFFGRGERDPDGVDPAERLGAGDVPTAAGDRLSELSSSGMFTSTLSVNEFALLTDLGPQPIAQVLGASVYQVGWQNLPPEAQWAGQDFSGQLFTISQAWGEARRLAFDRLREEARVVGAHSVVGVRLARGEHDWARRAVDFVVSGTAIRMPGPDPAANRPVLLSDLSGQDYWRLSAGGWEPAGLLATTSVMFVSQGRGTRWRRRTSVMSNQEIHEFSDGFSTARRSAVADLRAQARSASAEGVVGISLHYEMSRGNFTVIGRQQTSSGLSPTTIGMGGDMARRGDDKRSGLVFTVHAVGTAIRRSKGVSGSKRTMMVNLGGAL